MFDRAPAVAFFHEFDPILAKRLKGGWLEQPFQIMLALMAGVDRPRTLFSIRLCHQLAWFHAGIHRVKELKYQYELITVYEYIKELVGLQVTGLTAVMRTTAIANLCQRGGPGMPYFDMLNGALETSNANGKHRVTSWTVLEKIVFVWLCVVAGEWPSWLSEDPSFPCENLENPQGILSEKRSSCRNFVDILLLCNGFIEKEDGASMLTLAGNLSEHSVMVLLTSTGAKGESVKYVHLGTR